MTLAARSLTVSAGGQLILDNVSFSVAPGELVGLIGPNAAGKSTLLRSLAGLQDATTGDVTIEGNRLAALSPRNRALRVACLLQNAMVHWPLAVGEVVALGRHPHGGGASDEDAVVQAMVRVEIEHLRDKSVAELSAGERMRVHMARALAVTAPYLLADEPVASLDPYHQLECMELLVEEARTGTGVAVVLHDLLLAARFCDRLVLLADGRVHASGTPADVLTETAVRNVYQVEALRQDLEGRTYVLPWRRAPRAD